MTRKIALVTGAGTGVGKAAALALASAGHDLVLAGRRAAPLEAVAAAIGDRGAKAISVATDIGDPEAVNRLFEAVGDTYGRLDLLFNNAGMGTPAVPMEEITFEQWSAVVAVNLTGAFLCTQGAIRMMKAQDPRGGRIINNGSISAHVPRPMSAPYTATKHAMTGLTRSTSLDGRDFDIVCGQIDIGNAATEMTARMADGVPQADGRLAAEPTIDVRHIADMVVHMAGLPLDANVQFVTVMANKMPFIGRG